MSILVSVVIPVYNSFSYLDDCLRSVIGQTYKNIEVIIINDGSTDRSEDIIKKYVASDTRIKLISQENHGLGYTRNKGIQVSKGSYIFFLDSDDILPDRGIELLVKATSKHEADYSAGKVLRFNAERYYVPVRHVEFKLYDKNESTTLIEKPEMLQDSIACNKLWRKDFLLDNNLFFTEGKYYEDMHFTLRAAALAKKIAVVKETVYYWRVRENENMPSITQQQMKLENTRDRLNALSSNKLWLVKSKINPQIIIEHDLKSLLDVLRLHVIKYALIHAKEKIEWQKEIIAFLKQIPKETADMLPRKEKNLYDLVMEENYSDLQLFSEMYTNTEICPIVAQEGQHFLLQGKSKTYDVTNDIKPTIIVKEIHEQNKNWILRGELTIPKASFPSNGDFYVINRLSKEIIKLESLSLEPIKEDQLYPFEKQLFEIEVDPKSFQKKSTYDFYFQINSQNQQSPQTRVRLHSKAKGPYIIKTTFTKISLYRTNYGNLSIKVLEIPIIQKVKKMINHLLYSSRK